MKKDRQTDPSLAKGFVWVRSRRALKKTTGEFINVGITTTITTTRDEDFMTMMMMALGRCELVGEFGESEWIDGRRRKRVGLWMWEEGYGSEGT